MVKKLFVPKNLCVIYHNDFHKINLSSLSVLESNLLFSIFNDLKNTNEKEWGSNQLLEMASSGKRISNRELYTIVTNLENKFFNLNFKYIYKEKNIEKTQITHLFSSMKIQCIDGNITKLRISLNPGLEYLLHDLRNKFLSFDLKVYKSFSSKYTQTIYRYICQYSNTGILKMDYDEFKIILGIPDTYQFSDIKRRIIEPSIKDINNIINGLNYEIIKKRINGKLQHKYIIFKFCEFQYTINEKYSFDFVNSKNKNTLMAIAIINKRIDKKLEENTDEDMTELVKIQKGLKNIRKTITGE